MKIKIVLTLFFLCAAQAFAVSSRDVQTGEKVSFKTPDGVIISGLFHKPASSLNKTFILLHGLGSNQEEWQSFTDKLVSAGYGVLSYDARGHGKSSERSDGRNINYNNFGPPGPGSEWGKMIDDLGDAVNFLKTEKNITVKKVGLIGASVGANVCLIYAAKTPEISVVVLLSPGLNYAGFGTLGAIEAFTARPIELSASPQDTYAYQSSILLYQKVQGNKRASFLPGAAGHGVQMFDGKFDNQLIKWIRAH